MGKTMRRMVSPERNPEYRAKKKGAKKVREYDDRPTKQGGKHFDMFGEDWLKEEDETFAHYPEE